MENKTNIPEDIKHPYQVPNKYFDSARQEVLNKTVRQTSSSYNPFKKWSLIGATSLSFVFLIGFFIFFNDKNEAPSLPTNIVVASSEYELYYDMASDEMEAELMDDLLDIDLDDELDELILSSIDGDINSTDLYINDVELELEYYENE